MTDDPLLVRASRAERVMRTAVERSLEVPQFTLDASLARVGEPRAAIDRLVVAVAAALVDHPRLNASYADEGHRLNPRVNVALAVADGDLLAAPAILDTDRLTLAEVARERRRLTGAVRDRALTPDEAYGGTFTISNLGPFGITRFRSLVIPPQVASLAVGAVGPAGDVALTLSCDHRVINGAPAAVFLRDVVTRFEAL